MILINILIITVSIKAITGIAIMATLTFGIILLIIMIIIVIIIIRIIILTVTQGTSPQTHHLLPPFKGLRFGILDLGCSV